MANYVGICILVITCAFVASQRTTTPTVIYSTIFEDDLVPNKSRNHSALEVNFNKNKDEDDLILDKPQFYEEHTTGEYNQDYLIGSKFQSYENNSTVEYDQDDLIPTKPVYVVELSESTDEYNQNNLTQSETEFYVDQSTVDYNPLHFFSISEPRNLSVLEVNTNEIRLSWIKPQRDNGDVNGYYVDFETSNYGGIRTINILPGTARIEYTLDGLNPNAEYRIFVQAFNDRNEGKPSKLVVNMTDIGGPSAPQHLNVTCQARNKLFIQWERPYNYFYTIDYYNIYINIDESSSYNNYSIPTSEKHIEVMYSVTNITTNRMYTIQVTGASYSKLTGRLLEGQVSDAKRVYVNSNCSTQQQSYEDYSTVEYDQDELNFPPKPSDVESSESTVEYKKYNLPPSEAEFYVEKSTVEYDQDDLTETTSEFYEDYSTVVYDQFYLYPSEPRNLSVLEVNSNEIRLSWNKPRQENRDINGYMVHYWTSGYLNFRIIKVSPMRAYFEYTLDGLKPNTAYGISVKALTSRGEGKSTKVIWRTTANRGPSAPRHLNVVCQANNTIFIQWERPRHFLGTIDYYYINILYLNENITYQNFTIPTSQDYLKVSFSVANVTSNTYKVQVRGASYSKSSDPTLIQGRVTEDEVDVQLHCDKLKNSHYNTRRATVCSELYY